MSAWVIPAPLSQPVPRRTRLIWSWFAFGLFFILAPLVPVAYLVSTILGPESETNMFEARGVDIDGKVLDLDVLGTSRLRYTIHYIYMPKELAGTPDRTVDVKTGLSFHDYWELRVGGAVPLIYDPLHPERAELKSVAEAHRNHKGVPWWVPVLLIVSLPAAATLLVLLPYLLWFYSRQKRLLQWGKAAEATIVRQLISEYKGRRSQITYTFKDERGATVMGRQTINLGARGDPCPALIALTVLYDPHRSGRNMLYPGSAVRLVE